MEIVSSAKNLILSSFPELETKFIYKYTENDSIDFQFLGLRKYFISVNKKNNFEVLRASNEDSSIQRIKKIRVDNIYCVACPKQDNTTDLALGTSDGRIKLFNYKTLNYTDKLYSEPSRDSVLHLDYNASDEYLSSVYENGLINIYGMKTKIKIQTLEFDKTCTLSKFHPIKKYHLGVATYQGGVYMYDLQMKNEVFGLSDSHKSPCRDIAMSAALPDLLSSAGYDCIVNVYDIRKKRQSFQIVCERPLSSIAMSECGRYICTGNLKGELISYDIRNTRTYLNCQKAHNSSVVRIEFVPDRKITEAVRESLAGFNSIDNFDLVEDTRIQSVSRRSTINLNEPEISVGKNNAQSVNDNKPNKRRDSFLDFIDKFTNDEMSKNNSSNKLLSFDIDGLNLDVIKKSNDFHSSEIDFESKPEAVYTANTTNTKFDIPVEMSIDDVFEDDLNVSQKHQESKINHDEYDHGTPKTVESKLKARLESIEEFPKLPDHKNSTPNIVKSKLDRTESSSNEAIKQLQSLCVDIKNELQNLRTNMETKIDHLENEMKYTTEMNKWQLINYNTRLAVRQNNANEEIREALAYLLKTDDFLNEFVKLRKENEHLKAQFLKLNQRRTSE